MRQSDETLDMALTLTEVANGREDMQKVMGSVEDYEKLMDRVDDLDAQLQDMDVVLGEDAEMPDITDILAEVDAEEPADTTTVDLPDAPTVIHKEMVAPTKQQETERVAELE